MNTIQVLDKKMAELIAAGEVIDRPASVIKELVENSLDAGATQITVEIAHGGVTFMRVTDNGGGIARGEIARAFLRHATSKLKSEEDLQNIATMGFRGEALASIAAMCRVEVLSRTPEETEGARYRIEGGEELENAPCGCPAGTTILVRDIFFNTPARMKFLKKDMTEGAAVGAVLDKIAAANPHVALRFLRDGKSVLQTPGNNRLADAVYAVWGRQFFQSLAEVSHEWRGVRVRGFVSKPNEARASRSMQSFFINARTVRSRTLMAALEEAYHASIMRGKYPSCVLDIRLPPSVYDINVHPAKLEVRFADEKLIFDSVFYAVQAALASLDASGVAARLEAAKPAVTQFELRQDILAEGETLRIDARLLGAARSDAPAGLAEVLRGTAARSVQAPAPLPRPIPAHAGAVGEPSNGAAQEDGRRGLSHPAPEADGACSSPPAARAAAAHMPPPPREAEPERERAAVAPASEQNREVGRRYENARLIGEVFATYILLECEERLILIDKHAAHERLLYEQLRCGAQEPARQILLSPVAVTLERDECAALLQRPEAARRLGFALEDFGEGCVLVREAPVMLDAEHIAPSVTEIAARLALTSGGEPQITALDELYHMIACKAAIKANDETKSVELQALVHLLDEHEEVRFCPHGRPIATVITRAQLERMFGRA